MKKKYIILMILAVIGASLIAVGCSRGKADKFEAYKVDSMEILQVRADNYNLNITPDFEVSADAKVYVSRYDKLKESDTPLKYTAQNGIISTNVTVGAGDYFIFIDNGNGNLAVQPMSIPKMNPYVLANSGYVSVYYEMDGNSSWSSYVDPAGKNIYRSTKGEFDSTAVAIKKNETILTEFSNDTSPSADAPYYYVVLTGKNGTVSFVTYSLLAYEDMFGFNSAQIIKQGEKPVLNVVGTLKPAAQNMDVYLRVKSGNEVYTAESSNSQQLDIAFDLSQLTLDDIWYDVELCDRVSGKVISVPDRIKVDSSVTVANKMYTFKEWEGKLKVMSEDVSQAYAITEVTLTVEGATPTLTVSGDILDTSKSISLILRYQSGDMIELGRVENSSTESGKFILAFDLSSMTEAGNWHDIQIAVGSKDYPIPSSLVDMTQKIQAGNRNYSFKEYAGSLKIEFTN